MKFIFSFSVFLALTLSVLATGSSHDLPLKDEVCKPSSRWIEDGCNWCQCSNDGKSFGCTRILCLPDSPSNRVDCVPGSRWKRDCNWCFCDNNRRISCTEIACG